MKRILALMLALTLMACGATALADWQTLDTLGVWLQEDEQVSIDLDGDGTEEAVGIAYIPDDFEPYMQLQVMAADGTVTVCDTGIIFGRSAWACDLNGDGVTEIFLWGDVLSDDYYTWCLHYAAGRLVPVLFADVNRGENGRGYFKQGYGELVDANLEDVTVTLSGSQDVLGTYFMERTLKLTEDGLFETADDGMWVRDVSDFDDDVWEEAALTVKASVPCKIDGEAAVLEPGERLMITGTDKDSVATFLTRDGRAGELAIGENYMQGWGSLVDGIPEEDAFEYLPYAD